MTTPTPQPSPIAPGSLTRGTTGPLSIWPGQVDPTNPPRFYGQPLVANPVNGLLRPIQAPDTPSMFAGVLLRPPTQDASPAPPTNGRIDLVRTGYVAVQVQGIASTFKGCPAFVRTGAPRDGQPIGGIEAAADGANTLRLPGAYFTGPADSSGVAELGLNV